MMPLVGEPLKQRLPIPSQNILHSEARPLHLKGIIT